MLFNNLTKADMKYIHNTGTQKGGIKKIMQEYDVSENTVRVWFRKINKIEELRKQTNVDETDIAEVLRLYEKGVSYTQIAKKLSMSKLLVKNILLSYTSNCSEQRKGRKYKTCPTLRRFIENPNEPTATTVMLVQHYYDEDIHKHRMSHDEAIRDISVELGRTREYIEECLRGRF